LGEFPRKRRLWFDWPIGARVQKTIKTRSLAVGVAICLLTTLGWAQPSIADILPAPEARSVSEALKAVDEKNSFRAKASFRKIKNPLARKIVTWARLSQPDPKASFAEIAGFMAENPDWPDNKELQRRAEEAMSGQADAEATLNWFKDKKPLSGDGMASLGEALMASGRTAEAKKLLRKAWINGDFTKRRARAFYKRHRRLLGIDDHWQRLDRLLWKGRYWPVRRMMWKVKPDYRALAVARMFLRQRRGNVDTAIAKVPDHLNNDPGLIYERLRWRRRRGKYEGAMEILDNPPNDLIHPQRWWVERAAVARQALQKGHVSDAYRLARNHGLKSGKEFAEAEWLSGWIALQFLNDAPSAKDHFLAMYKVVKFPVSRARGAYWAGRAFSALNDKDSADIWYRKAALHSTTYYGQLSAARLRPGDGLEMSQQAQPGGRQEKAFEAQELVAAVRLLAEIGEQDRLKPFILRLNEMAKSPDWKILTAALAEASGRPDLSVSIAKRAARKGLALNDAAYPSLIPPPMHVRAGTQTLEVPLVLAVIRQESVFHVSAKSHANAQGLMQLLPRTARKVAMRLGIPFSRRRLVTDGAYNLTLGQAYLSGLVEEFKGSYVLALAAYNAGPNRARQWLKRNGDLRKADVDSIDWVEMIPFNETRNYIQRVLENLQVYRHRLAHTEVALGLERDLHQ